MGGKERNERRRTGFSGAGPYGRDDFGPVSVGIEGNQDAGSITEAAVLKINETIKIREIARLICDIP